MDRFRGVGLWAVGLVWLAVGVGCAGAAEKDTTPGKVEKYTGPRLVTEEIDPVDTPLSEEPGAVEIPLSQITAFPPSQDIAMIGGELHNSSPDEYRRDWEPLMLEIYRSLSQRLPKDGNVPPGFAVVGAKTDLEALQQVHKIIVHKQPPRESFPAGSEITLVFFSYKSDPFAAMHRVDRAGHRMEIRYRFVWDDGEGRAERTSSLIALISLGKLESGKYHVNVVKSALERKLFGPDFVPGNAFQEKMARELENRVYKPMSREEARKMVCNPFSFSVEK